MISPEQAAWSTLMRAPLLRASVSFMLGIGLARWATPLPAWCWAAVLLSAGTYALLALRPFGYAHRWHMGAALVLFWATFGALWQVLHDPLRQQEISMHAEAGNGPWLVELRSVNNVPGRTIRGEVHLRAVVAEGEVVPAHGRLLATLMLEGHDVVPVVGDRIWLDAGPRPIDRLPDPGGFDRQVWARSKGIAYEVFATPDHWWSLAGQGHWSDMFHPARDRVAGWLGDSGLPKRERAIVKALVLGSRDELDDAQKSAFARSGTMHVLAVSGMHVGLIYAIFSTLLAWMGQRQRARVMRGVMLVVLLWCYAGLTGAAPSVLRASIMFSFFAVAGMMGRRTEQLNSLFAAALVLLLFDPLMLGQLSFQFSFLAVLGIVLFYRPLHALWSPSARILRYAWSLTAVSIAAQLATTPLALYTFKAFPVWFLPANLVVVFQITIAVVGGGLLIALHRVPFLGEWIGQALELQLRFLGASTEWFATLPGAYPDIRISLASMLLLYLLIASVACWIFFCWRLARWTMALTLLALLLLWVRDGTQRDRESSFTVYDSREGLLAGMKMGRELVVLADDTALVDPWAQRKLENHVRAEGTLPPRILRKEELLVPRVSRAGNTLAAAGRWQAPGLRVALAEHQDALPLPHEPPVDVLLLSGRGRYELEECVASFAPGAHVVLLPDMPAYRRSFLRRWCADEGISCHDVRLQGAFHLRR